MKFNKSTLSLLICALVFTIATLFLFSFSSTFIINSLILVYNQEEFSTVVVQGNYLYFVSFLCSIFTACLSSGILPFDIILMKKMDLNNWYTKALFIFSIVIIALSLLIAFSLPALYTHADSARINSVCFLPF